MNELAPTLTPEHPRQKRKIKVPVRQESQRLFWKNIVKQTERSPRLPIQERVRVSRERTADQLRTTRERERSKKDPLTGFLNRKGFEAKLEEEAKRARRFSTPLTIMFFDLNKLKNVNDTEGHQAGDELIKMAAEIIAEGREYDRAARWGGDEFAKILPETSEEDAMLYWGRINKVFQDKGVSIVAGIIQVDPSSEDTVRESWRLCDLAEIEAKKKSHELGGGNIILNARDLPNEIILAA